MASENDKKGTAVIRTVENRLVWLLAYATARLGSPHSSIEQVAKAADTVVDEYQTRFPEITPAQLPE